MKFATGRELSKSDECSCFRIHFSRLELPSEQLVSAQEILAGIAPLEIQSELELRTSANLLRYTRAISRIK